MNVVAVKLLQNYFKTFRIYLIQLTANVIRQSILRIENNIILLYTPQHLRLFNYTFNVG